MTDREDGHVEWVTLSLRKWPRFQLVAQVERLHEEVARLQHLDYENAGLTMDVDRLRESVAGYVARTDAMAAEIKRLRAMLDA